MRFFHSLLECQQISGEDLEAKGLQLHRERLGDFGVDCVDGLNAGGADVVSPFAGATIFVCPRLILYMACTHLF